MEKQQLQTLTLDQLKVLFKENQDFQHAVFETAYENNMFWQNEWYNEMLGKNNRGFRYYDDRCSFYLRLTNAETFLNDLGNNCRDYLSQETAEIYDRAKELLNKWQDMTYEEQVEDEETFDEMEETAVKLLQEIEKSLHDFETVTNDEIEETLNDITNGITIMGEWELAEDGKTIVEHITKYYK